MSEDIWPEWRDFVGFYWTLPMPALGFVDLPKDVEAAARVSQTIRYQRERVCRHVGECRGHLIDEIVYMEVRPDRGTEHVRSTVARALRACAGGKAQLLHVDFAYAAGWRQHPFLARLMQEAPVSCLGLTPDPMPIDGVEFDPVEHFRQHRDAASQGGDAATRRAALAATVLRIAEEAGEGPGRYRVIAEQLNAESVRTRNGRSWTADNVKQFLRATKIET